MLGPPHRRRSPETVPADALRPRPGKTGLYSRKFLVLPHSHAGRRENDLAGCDLRPLSFLGRPGGHPGPGLSRRLEHIGHGRLLVGDQAHLEATSSSERVQVFLMMASP